jgi:predicted nucleic acid-binding protein
MASRFFDTSAAAKHYRAELGSAKVDAFLAEPGSLHIISNLTVVEFHSVLARLVRIGQLPIADFHLVRGRFLADIAGGLWHVEAITAHHFHRAQQLILTHGLTRSIRTLDALQLAVAISRKAVDEFVCADTNLCITAAAEALTVVNPELP